MLVLGKEYVKANVQDAARAIVLATERYNKSEPVNIGGWV